MRDTKPGFGFVGFRGAHAGSNPLWTANSVRATGLSRLGSPVAVPGPCPRLCNNVADFLTRLQPTKSSYEVSPRYSWAPARSLGPELPPLVSRHLCHSVLRGEHLSLPVNTGYSFSGLNCIPLCGCAVSYSTSRVFRHVSAVQVFTLETTCALCGFLHDKELEGEWLTKGQ